jgi:uncharacterized protein YjbI with pentapeptide repeats
VDLTGANLTGPILYWTKFYRVDLGEVILVGADLTGADLYRVDFTRN